MEKGKLKEVIDEFISERDLFLVEINCTASNIIEVVIDSMSGVQIDTCIELTRFIESRFDREDEDYELTVASTSISEPFALVQQYHKNIGKEIEVWIKGEVVGEKQDAKKEGILTSVDEESFTITYSMKVSVEGKKKKEEKEFCDTIKFAEVKSTRLIIKF